MWTKTQDVIRNKQLRLGWLNSVKKMTENKYQRIERKRNTTNSNDKHYKECMRLSMTCKTRFGRFLSSSSVICVRYVGLSKTGGLL